MTQLMRRSLAVPSAESLPQPGPELWVYLLFDAARVPNAAHLLDAYRVQHSCLFRGQPGEDLADVAPWLVAVEGASPQAQDFIWQVLADGHGLLLHAPAGIDPLRRHLKKFLRGRIDGREVYVKFYTARNFDYLLQTDPALPGLFSMVDAAIYAEGGFDNTFVAVTAKGA